MIGNIGTSIIKRTSRKIILVIPQGQFPFPHFNWTHVIPLSFIIVYEI